MRSFYGTCLYVGAAVFIRSSTVPSFCMVRVKCMVQSKQKKKLCSNAYKSPKPADFILIFCFYKVKLLFQQSTKKILYCLIHQEMAKKGGR